jgi:hypothetical protein
VIVEVESNSNCEQAFFGRFKELSRPRQVSQIKLFDRRPDGEWCDVTGWSDDPDQPCCPAWTCPVEDSGAGTTHLVYGGIFGLRFKPVENEESWSLESRNQWGEAYVAVADSKDLRFSDAVSG